MSTIKKWRYRSIASHHLVCTWIIIYVQILSWCKSGIWIIMSVQRAECKNVDTFASVCHDGSADGLLSQVFASLEKLSAVKSESRKNWSKFEVTCPNFCKEKSLSRVRLFVTPWTVAYQAPPSMGFPKQEYWSGLPFPSQGDLPDPGIESRFPALQTGSLSLSHQGSPIYLYIFI